LLVLGFCQFCSMNAGCFAKAFGWMDADVLERYLLIFCHGL
ncbi:unnamed protein product, partial [Prunus brigantina]